MNVIEYNHISQKHNKTAANEILPYLFAFYMPNSILDVGCGTGSWLHVAKVLGVKEICGIDGIRVDNDILEVEEKNLLVHNLTSPINLHKKFDLAICLEVVEHLPQEYADVIIDTLVLHADAILFSAAIPFQGGQSHINEQTPRYWQQKFAEKNYVPFDILRDHFWGNEKIEWWYKQNIVIYAKPLFSDFFGEASKEIILKIHPELFALRTQEKAELLHIVRNYIYKPKFLSSLKLAAKALLKQ